MSREWRSTALIIIDGTLFVVIVFVRDSFKSCPENVFGILIEAMWFLNSSMLRLICYFVQFRVRKRLILTY